MKKFHCRRSFAYKAAALIVAVALSLPVMGYADESEPVYSDAATQDVIVRTYTDQTLILPDGESTLEKVGEKGSLSLFASMENGEFAITDSATGSVWYSNPPDRWDDPYSGGDRPATLSLMLAHYVDMSTQVDEYPTSYGACEIEDGIAVERIANGIVITFTFVEAQVVIPLRIELTDHGFTATVDVTKIQENGNKTLMDISLLPYFGAGGVEDDGYIVVPDGSGALIDFNNGKQNFARYQEPIYGLDSVLVGEQRTKTSELSALPLFGIKNGNAGFAAIITEGDAVANVTAGVSKKGSGYNNVYAGFTLRSSDYVNLAGKDIPIYEKGSSHIKTCTVDYRLLTGDDATYTGIAKTYADYLREEIGIQPKSQELSLFAEVYGAVRLNRSILGIPAKVTQSLTTFSQAQELTDMLRQAGVSRMILDYQNFDRSALRGKLSTAFRPDSALGGKSGYEELKSYLDSVSVPLVSNVNLTTYAATGNGISKRGDAAKAFAGLPGVKYTFNLATEAPDESVPFYYYLAPSRLLSVTKGYMKSYDAARFGAIGLDNLATCLYSDFSTQDSGRQNTSEAFAAAAAYMAQSSEVYLRGGAAHLLKSAAYIYDMPDDDSQYDIVDRSIPLYQLAISGLIPYSLTSVNGKPDPDKQLLKSIEYGADLKFNFTYSDPGITGDPSLGYLSGVWYEPWLDYAAQAYSRVAAFREQAGDTIAAHEMVQPQVYVTTYSGGVRVAVNYTNSDVMVESTPVPAMDFAVLSGGDHNE